MTISEDDVSVREAVRGYVVDASIQVANLHGLSDACGVLRGSLLLSIDPVSMDDLVSMTGYSKSTISSSMSLLENFGIVKRVVKPGDKRYHYLPVNDPDTMMVSVLDHAKKEFTIFLVALDKSEKLLESTGSENHEIREAIFRIKSFYSKIIRFLDLMASYTTDELIEILEVAKKNKER